MSGEPSMTAGQSAPSRPAPPVMPGACASGGCGCGSGSSSSTGSADAKPAVVRLQRRGPRLPDRVAVNGVEIPAAAIGEEAQQHAAASPEAAWLAAARALAIRELLLQEARRLAIEAEPEADEDGRVELPEEALIRALLEREAQPPRATEEECRRYYAARIDAFRTPDLFEAAHILTEPVTDDDAGWAAAEREARVIAAEVGLDARAFAAVARERSRCPSSRQDGSLGQVQRGELLPEVQALIESLAEGTVGREPVRSRFGWHVVRLDRRIPGRQLPFEMVRDRIENVLEARGWALAAASYTARLAANARVEGVAIQPAPHDGGAA